MITGQTKSGFEYTIDERIQRDYEMSRLGSLMRKGEQAEDATLDMFKFVFGDEQLARLVEHVRSLNDGFCPWDSLIVELQDVFQQAFGTNAIKN